MRGGFSRSEHFDITQKLLGATGVCSRRIARAQYRQDTDPAAYTDSAAHFSNCAILEGAKYVHGQTETADMDIKHNRRDEALDALGRALQATQEFYAHTNYVALMESKYPESAAVPIVPFWTKDGISKLEELLRSGLTGGYNALANPKFCGNEAKPEVQIALESESTPAGSIRIQRWNNKTRYRAASELASRASYALISYALDRWPVLLQGCNDELYFLRPFAIKMQR
jgi:hypothetical protein